VSRKIALAGAAIAVVAVVPAVAVAGVTATASRPVKKTVKVRDNFYSPLKLDVPVDSTVTWKWPTVPGDVHDVFSAKRPKGAKKFHSELAASDYSFKRKLTTPGTYKVICTIHEEMTMTIKVRK
jgi:plastocyanin